MQLKAVRSSWEPGDQAAPGAGRAGLGKWWRVEGEGGGCVLCHARKARKVIWRKRRVVVVAVCDTEGWSA